MKLSTLATCGAAALATSAQSEEWGYEELRALYPVSPVVEEFNQTVPAPLRELQACLRSRFENFALTNEDGSQSYLLSRSFLNMGERVFTDITFPPEGALMTGETLFSQYVTRQDIGPDGTTLVTEISGGESNFTFPMTQTNLFENGLFGQLYPEAFQSNQVNRFNEVLARTSQECAEGLLTAEDLPSYERNFWNEVRALHESARTNLERCIQSADTATPDLQFILDTYSFPITEFAEHGFEDPYEATYQLEAAYGIACSES